MLVDWIKENENLKKELAEVRVEKNTIQDKLAAEERELAWHTRHKDAQNELVSVKKDIERYGFVCFSNLSESIFCPFPWIPWKQAKTYTDALTHTSGCKKPF